MPWIWQLKDWPHFRWLPNLLFTEEQQFIESVSITIGSLRHLPDGEREGLNIALLERNALDTAAIEGETLDRSSVQSSLRKHLGLRHAFVPSKPREDGIAEMTANLYLDAASPLTHARLFDWHRMLMNGRRDIACIGSGSMPLPCRSFPVKSGMNACITKRHHRRTSLPRCKPL